MTDTLLVMIPLSIYLGIMLYIAYRTNELKVKGKFIEEYFIGNRSMGGFVLAMTLIATYASAGSFIGGPGVAYKMGLGWVLLASIQIPTAFLTLGILGKKFAIISRKINGVTITDYLRARYKSDVVVILSSIAVLVFFTASMTAQFVGGARLFETATGLSYQTGLIIFGVVVILYTSFGGFRAVSLTDTIQGIVMMIAVVFLFTALLKQGGGMEKIMKTVGTHNPELLTPDAGGKIAKPFILSFWILVGVALLGLPQTSVRCMGFKDSKSMHNAMIIGTFVVGFLMLGMHLLAVMGIAINPDIEAGDKIIPTLSFQAMPRVIAGIFIGGPLAATMSTIDSMLILASAAVIKDLYINYFPKKEGTPVDSGKIKKITFLSTLIIGTVVFFLAFHPPKLLVWINLFAFGGLEAAFLWPIVLGLYWRKANAGGAIASMLVGVTLFILLTVLKIRVFETHQIVISLLVSLAAFIAGSLLYKPKDRLLEEQVDEIFF